MDPTAHSPYYPSYEEYLSSLCRRWPEYQWLREFFQHRPIPSQGMALMVDAADGNISTRSFSSGDRGRFLNALVTFTTTAHTKIVMIPYKRPEDVDRGLLDTLGLALDIDPLFYWHHFDLRTSPSDRSSRSRTSHPLKTPCLASQQTSLELGFYAFLHASVLFIPHNREQNQWTVLVLLRASGQCKSNASEFERPSIYDPPGQRRIARHRDLYLRFHAILETWSREEINSANEAPIEFIYPLAHLMATDHAYRLHHEFSFEEFSAKAFGGGSDWIRYSFEFEASVFRYAVNMHLNAIKATLESLKYHCGDVPRSNSELLRRSNKAPALIYDYESLLETARRLLNELDSIETRSINHRSVKASLMSIEQSESLSRLTILAFFFIPLSFATSIFGMNVEELGSGTVKMRVVILTTTFILAVVAVFWFISASVSRALGALRMNLDGIRFRTRVLKAFSVISPQGAFWLFVFGLTHDPSTFTSLVRELGIWAVLGLGKEWDAPVIGTEEQIIKLSRFWQRRAEEIVSITRRRGWQRVNFRMRWRRNGLQGDVGGEQATS